MKFLIDNIGYIITTVIAILAIIIPVYYQFYRNKKKKDIPETLIIAIGDYQEQNKYLKEQISLLQIEFDNIKAIGSTFTDFTIKNVNLISREIINSSNKISIEKKLDELINNILLQSDNFIITLHTDPANLYYKNLIETFSFKKKIDKIIMNIYFNSGIDDHIRSNAALLWIYLMENECESNFLTDQLLFPANDENEKDIVRILWQFVNLGFMYHYEKFSDREGIDLNVKFKKFNKTLIDKIVDYINHDNLYISEAAAWSLVWVINARNENQNKKLEWLPNYEQEEILYNTLANSKNISTIKSLVYILDFISNSPLAFKGNFTYDCANSIDTNTECPRVNFTEINSKLSQVIYIKYISGSGSIKPFLAKYLAKYGVMDSSIASILLEYYLKEDDDKFISSVLIPYIGLFSDRGLLTYAISWIKSKNKKKIFYGYLLQKILEAVSKSIFENVKNNRHIIPGLKELAMENSRELQLYNKKAKLVYNVIKLMIDFEYEVIGKDTTGRVAWYYILVDPDKINVFLLHKKGDSYDLADYGRIIESGYGDEVPKNIHDRIFRKYA